MTAPPVVPTLQRGAAENRARDGFLPASCESRVILNRSVGELLVRRVGAQIAIMAITFCFASGCVGDGGALLPSSPSPFASGVAVASPPVFARPFGSGIR